MPTQTMSGMGRGHNDPVTGTVCLGCGEPERIPLEYMVWRRLKHRDMQKSCAYVRAPAVCIPRAAVRREEPILLQRTRLKFRQFVKRNSPPTLFSMECRQPIHAPL